MLDFEVDDCFGQPRKNYFNQVDGHFPSSQECFGCLLLDIRVSAKALSTTKKAPTTKVPCV